MKSLSVVVPCRDEEENVGPLVARLSAVRLPEGWTLRAVLVDDGSTDSTWSRVRALAEAGAAAGVRLDGNHGVQRAIVSGLALAGGDAAAVIDADLQDPPELLGPMLSAMLEAGTDAAVGVKRRRRDGSALLARAKDAAALLLPFVPGEGDFCVLTRACAERALELGRPETPFRVRRLWALGGRTPVYVPYERSVREAGESKFDWLKLARLFILLRAELARGPERGAAFRPPVRETAGELA